MIAVPAIGALADVVAFALAAVLAGNDALCWIGGLDEKRARANLVKLTQLTSQSVVAFRTLAGVLLYALPAIHTFLSADSC